jgi:tRNA threonylcarbamoyladenosine biosynthesis protein TsaE
MTRLLLRAAADTERLGRAVALTVPWRTPQPLTVFLRGELGTGKTTLARGLLRALGVKEPVRSPTYALVENYVLEPGLVIHVDLYRLRGAAELDGLGLRDDYRAGVLLLIEWPERASTALPVPELIFLLTPEGEARSCELLAGSAVGAHWLRQLMQEFSSEI